MAAVSARLRSRALPDRPPTSRPARSFADTPGIIGIFR
jgi:hypothetical protein